MKCWRIFTPPKMRFNRNMGCIEMLVRNAGVQFVIGLIETWDVLKYTDVNKVFQYGYKFNRNMGCIEIGERTR